MSSDTLIGYVAVAIAMVCFGSNFVPVKKFETGDGMYFQWVLCSAVWVVGLIVNLAHAHYTDGLNSSVQFYPFAMLGGILWCIGNSLAVTIIKCVGLGLGMVIWSSVNLVLGWASGAFGLFGLTKQPVTHPALNYAGAAIAIIGVGIFAMIQPSEKEKPATNKKYDSIETRYLLNDPYRVNNTESTPEEEPSFIDKLDPIKKRLLGVVLAAISGVFYGVNFDPPEYIIDHTTVDGKSTKVGLDFVFSHFSGIMVASTLIMVLYSIFKRNKPVLYPQAFLPGLISGVLWAIAQVAFFVANDKLSMVISFPLVATGPGIIANLWGVFVFKEIQGKKNLILLVAAFAVVITAAVLIALSKT